VANASGAVTLTMVTSDAGNTGSGGTLTDTDTSTITVNAVNDAPVNTLPASFATNEDTSVTLSGLSIADVDAASGTMSVTLSVASGTLAATSGGGVTVTGSGTGSLVLSGTLSAINTFLGVSAPLYTPVANASGAVTLTMVTSDGGNTGSGGTLSDTDTSTITVNAVNDAPVNTLPASFSTNEDTSVTLSGLSIADVDAASGTMSVTLSVASGTLAATSGGGVTVTGSGSGSIVLSGTLGAINSFLGGSAPVYTPVANASGAVTLTMVTSDAGNTGSGGTLTDTDTSTITVNAVNDAPVNTLPASFSTNEDTAVTLSGLSIADVDAASGTSRSPREPSRPPPAAVSR
jgi:large repetitive protein